MKKYLFSAVVLLLVALVCIGCGTRTSADGPTEASTASLTDASTDISTDAPPSVPTDTRTESTIEEETQVHTDPIIEPVTEAPSVPETSAPETGTPEAGLDSGIVRDGTPKKYVSFRFDDGITQDERIMELLRKYNMDCTTFYINTGLFGADWAWVGQQSNRPDVTHKRYTRAQISKGIYDGFEIGSHTLNHPSLKNCDDATVTREVGNDARTIARLVGYTPVGIAWPGGDTEWNEHNIETILSTTNIRYGSCTTATYSFQLPTYFMTWYPTCGFSDGNIMNLARQFIDAEPTEDMLFFVWGHGYEFDLGNSWDQFESLLKLLSEAAAEDDSIVFVTNAEFYQLFKDEIPAWKN